MVMIFIHCWIIYDHLIGGLTALRSVVINEFSTPENLQIDKQQVYGDDA